MFAERGGVAAGSYIVSMDTLFLYVTDAPAKCNCAERDMLRDRHKYKRTDRTTTQRLILLIAYWERSHYVRDSIQRELLSRGR